MRVSKDHYELEWESLALVLRLLIKAPAFLLVVVFHLDSQIHRDRTENTTSFAESPTR